MIQRDGVSCTINLDEQSLQKLFLLLHHFISVKLSQALPLGFSTGSAQTQRICFTSFSEFQEEKSGIRVHHTAMFPILESPHGCSGACSTLHHCNDVVCGSRP